MKLKTYPEYKDSSLPWLGNIPSHWDVRRNGRLFAQRNQTGFPDYPILEVSLRTGVRVRDFDNSKRKQVMSDREKYKLAVKGDIAYNMMRMWQGAVGVAPVDGLISPAYVVARPYPEVYSRYYTYLFRTAAYMDEVDKYSHGIVKDRNRLYWDEFKQIPSAFPPPDEQTTIANFLDQNRVLVHHFIRNKERLIGLLQEQKQAIINHAVTRGIDPDVRLKPSGIDWLGDVPEHWDIIRLKWVAKLNPSKSESVDMRKDVDEVAFLPMERVSTDGQIDPEIKSASEVWNGYTYFRKGDVVLAKITPCFENGKGAYLSELPTEFGFGTTEFIVLRAGTRILPEFLYLITCTELFRILGAEAMTGAAGQQRVPIDFVKDYFVTLPNPDEQQAIIRGVQKESIYFNAAASHARRQIDLIREYRTRLIADVVTGKVDVRGIPVEAVPEGEAPEEFAKSREMEEELDIGEIQDAKQ
jgi:type I restriction enzyme S subunit